MSTIELCVRMNQQLIWEIPAGKASPVDPCPIPGETAANDKRCLIVRDDVVVSV
jgi:hypothetical protein